MKTLLSFILVVPTLAFAELDESVWNGSSTQKTSEDFTNDSLVWVGASEVKKQTRAPASVKTETQEFQFENDSYNTGTSVKR